MLPDFPHAPSRSRVVIYLCAVVTYALACFSLIPVALSVADNVRQDNMSVLAPWAFPLIVACVAQFGYSLLVLQTRTSSAVWNLAICASVMSCMYSVFCGATWAAGRLLAPHALDQVLTMFGLWEATAGGKATLWSGAMAGAYALAAYFFVHETEAFRSH